MIFVQNVAKFFNGKPLFQNASISIHKGDRVGIIGPNGAGKSTILGMMEGLVQPDEGEVSVEKRTRMGVLHQELIHGNDGPILEEVMNTSEDLKNIRERLADLEIELPALSRNNEKSLAIIEEHGNLLHEFERYEGYTLEARALKILQGLGFKPEDVHRRWSEFSGGWRMRVALAKILLSEPDVLLLDEPTNHLDLESLLWVEDYLTNFKGALVLISHDRVFLNRLVNRIVEVDRGKVTSFTGDYTEYERTKQMQEDVIVASYKNQQEKIKKLEKFIAQNRVKARTASRAQSRIKMLDKMEKIELPTRFKTVKFTFPQPPPSGKNVVQIIDLVKMYDDITVYDHLNLSIDKGDRIGLVGPNGAGKSTLMKIIAGMIPYDSGMVKYGHQVTKGYFAQHQSESLNSERSVLEETYSSSNSVTEQEVRNLLGAFLFSGDDVFKKVKVLSGGEKSRLALAKILLSPPNLLLMDEPTNHLDIPSCEILEDGLKKFNGTLILITHDRRLMNSVCNKILEIEPGRTEFYIGNYEEYQYKKLLLEQQDIDYEPQETKKIPKISLEESRNSRKEKKRLDAESRAALSKAKAPLIKQIRGLEQLIEKKEQRNREIETIMADPESYNNRELILPLLEEGPALGREIKDLENQWEELQLKLSELEAAV